MHARSWRSPNPPVLPPPDPFLPARLRLEDAWLAPDGEWRPLEDQTAADLWSVLGYLRWHAPELRAADPDGVPFADPDGYLASRPLVTAIDAELARRGEAPAGESLAVLRAVGLAPWELTVSRQRRLGGHRSVPGRR